MWLPVRNVHVSERTRLGVVLQVARGKPVRRALSAAGYSVLTSNHKAILSGKKYLETARAYAATIAAEIGRRPIARELKLIETAEAWSRQTTKALRGIHEAYES